MEFQTPLRCSFFHGTETLVTQEASLNNRVTPIVVAEGDGIGPEIMESALQVITEGGAALDIQRIDIGEKLYRDGYAVGISPEGWDILHHTKMFLKSPVTTPQGRGYRNMNVAIRRTLGLFASIRPHISYHPVLGGSAAPINVVIIRENEEDLYTGIEHRQTDEVYQSLKLISRPGSERINRYAFEYTKDRERKKITCVTKSKIMKLTDGLFSAVFDEISEEYPEIETNHFSVNKAVATLAINPGAFDVMVVPNLYGDILADLAAELAGPRSIGASVSIGDEHAMFKGIQTSQPELAGKDIVNPSGMILAAAKMLAHIQQGVVAERVHNAWIKTIEDGIHTADIYTEGVSTKRVGTKEFTRAVVERLGQIPERIPEFHYHVFHETLLSYAPKPPAVKALVGVDVFLHHRESSADALASQLLRSELSALKLIKITNRGVDVWPTNGSKSVRTDHWRCRFLGSHDNATITHKEITALLDKLHSEGLDYIKTENLYLFDGEPGF